jgi:DNA-binding NarL/FixJ family response regulator
MTQGRPFGVRRGGGLPVSAQQQFRRESDDRPLGSPLTPRELEVLDAYAELGKWARVAERLGITLQTVKNHAMHAHARLGVDTTIEALRELGYIRRPPELDR